VFSVDLDISEVQCDIYELQSCPVGDCSPSKVNSARFICRVDYWGTTINNWTTLEFTDVNDKFLLTIISPQHTDCLNTVS